MTFLEKFKTSISLDFHSLAIFRVLTGLLILANLCLKLTDLEAFYTDNGVLPVYAWELFYKESGSWSLHAFSGTIEWILFLLVLESIAAISFIFGYKTRVSNIVLFVLHISLNFRNFLILDGGDCILVNLLLWSLFLPINRRLSVDSFLSIDKNKEESCSSLISFIYIMQIIFVYFTSAVLKVGHWETGNALFYALGLEAFNRPFTRELLNYPTLLKVSTFYVYYLEKYLWLLLFVPVYQKFFRYLTIFLFVSFHIGIIIFMEIGLFPFIGIVAWVPFLPGSFWDYFKRTKTEIIRVILKGKQGNIDQAKEFNNQVFGDSVVIVEEGDGLSLNIKKFNDRFCAEYFHTVLPNLSKSKFKSLLYSLRLKKALSKKRSRFELKFLPKIMQGILVLMAILMITLNLHIMKIINAPQSLFDIANKFHFQQNWVMFTTVSEHTGWGVAMGITKNNRTINLINKNENVWEKPESVVKYYGGIRWVKFHSIFKEKDEDGFKFNQLTKLYLNFLGQRWNEQNPDSPVEFVHYFYVYDEIGTDKPYEDFERHLIESTEILPKE